MQKQITFCVLKDDFWGGGYWKTGCTFVHDMITIRKSLNISHLYLSAMWTRYMISKQWVRIVGEQQLVGFPIPGCRVAEGRAPCSFFVLLMMIKKKNVRQTSSCKIDIPLTRQIDLTRRTNTIFNMEWFIFQYWQTDFIIWTNTFDNINKHISKAGQIQLTKLSTTFCYLRTNNLLVYMFCNIDILHS